LPPEFGLGLVLDVERAPELVPVASVLRRELELHRLPVLLHP